MATRKKQPPVELKGWKEIADFLGQPVALAKRWSRTEQLPIVKKGRYVTTTEDALNRWLGEGKRIASSNDDLTECLKAGLKSARKSA